MAEAVNRRRKLVIRTRVSGREKQLLIAQKRRLGIRTWREYMFAAGTRGSGKPVDLSQVAKLSGAVAALAAGPREVRAASAALLKSVESLGKLLLASPEPSASQRRAIEATIREAQSAMKSLAVCAERAELAVAPARDEIARVLRAVVK